MASQNESGRKRGRLAAACLDVLRVVLRTHPRSGEKGLTQRPQRKEAGDSDIEDSVLLGFRNNVRRLRRLLWMVVGEPDPAFALSYGGQASPTALLFGGSNGSMKEFVVARSAELKLCVNKKPSRDFLLRAELELCAPREFRTLLRTKSPRAGSGGRLHGGSTP